MAPTPGQILREARQRHNVSQKRLAIRAGTTQSAISRIEADRVSPSVATLSGLLHLLGESLVLEVVERESGIDREMTRRSLELSRQDRVSQGLAFSDLVRRNRGAAEQPSA